MSNKLSKFSLMNFKPVYRSRKLSLSTRIEMLRKRHLIKKAKLLLEKGLSNNVTPTPDTYEDCFEKSINVEVLAELLERSKKIETKKMIEYQNPEKKLDKGIFTDSESDNISDETDNYDSEKFEEESDYISDSDNEKAEKEPFVSESPELVDV